MVSCLFYKHTDQDNFEWSVDDELLKYEGK